MKSKTRHRLIVLIGTFSPLFGLLLIMLLSEVLLKALDYPPRQRKNLFDPGTAFVKDSNTGFKLIADHRFGLHDTVPSPPPDTLSILFLGDSCTFGSGVGRAQAYPQLVAALLHHNYPQRKVAVFNLAVPGFTSEQGKLKYIAQSALFIPDIVVLAFGFNDGQMSNQSDRKLLEQHTPASGVVAYLNRLRLVQLIRKLLSSIKRSRRVRRVSLKEFRENVRFIVSSQRAHHKQVMLVNTDFGSHYVSGALTEIASDFGIPLVDAVARFEEEKKKRQKELFKENISCIPRIEPKDERKSFYTIHVKTDTLSSREKIGILYYRGIHSAKPTMSRVWCRDDGIYPDMCANDTVWSAQIPGLATLPLNFIAFRWNGKKRISEFAAFDKPENPLKLWHTRIIFPDTNPAPAQVFISFGQLLLMRENIHPSVEGHRLIANLVYPRLLSLINGAVANEL